MKILFYSTRPYDKISFRETLKNYSNLEVTFTESSLNDQTVELADGYDAVCIFVNDNAKDAHIICKLYELGVKIIALRCAGYNNVDYALAEKFNIQVIRVPNYSPESVAEHAATLMMAVNRRIHKAYGRVRDNNFSLSGLSGYCLYGKTLGLIGCGRIGKCFADICCGLGMKIVCYDPKINGPIKDIYLNDEETANVLTPVHFVDTLDELYSVSDVISLHVPLLDSTKHMINKESIAKMKDNVILINVSRGGLIDNEALIEANKQGKFFGIGLDVYEGEDDNVYTNHEDDILMNCITSRLLSFPNVIVTSHQAFLTDVALEEIANTTCRNLSNIDEDKEVEGICKVNNC